MGLLTPDRGTAALARLEKEATAIGFRDRSLWDKRLRSVVRQKALDCAWRQELIPTPYFVEAVDYWRRAKMLQEMNLGLRRRGKVGDQLQEAIPIYDTVQRRYAGFSNVLEQLFYGEKAPKIAVNKANYRNYPRFKGTTIEWMYVCLVHRICGSGASFEHDHGWRNSVVPQMAELVEIPKMAAFIGSHRGPIFTSIGNQIPPFNKLVNTDLYRNAGQEYLAEVAPILVTRMYDYLRLGLETQKDHGPLGIQEAVDQALKIQRDLKCKQFKFVLTAWVMDLAEYFPHLVDATSDCYHGKNAQEAINVCFHWKYYGRGKQEFYDAGTRAFADITGTHPMDVEDASPGCDLIRWLENYVPKKGFDHVRQQEIFNSNSLRYPHGRQP